MGKAKPALNREAQLGRVPCRIFKQKAFMRIPARDRVVTTIEGVGATPVGAKMQKAWLDLEVIPCGYCQPQAAR
jgi:aerobic-type carbon monoxide dehydrogenase small subunit (CoxS/CutS family)